MEPFEFGRQYSAPVACMLSQRLLIVLFLSSLNVNSSHICWDAVTGMIILNFDMRYDMICNI